MTPQDVKNEYDRCAQLGRDLLVLGKRLSGDFPGIAPLTEALDRERPLFAIGAFGPACSGKTSLLEDILGAQWERDDDKQAEGCAVWNYCFMSRYVRTRLDGIAERHADVLELQNLTLVDSAPASDPLVRAQWPEAVKIPDINLWVFSLSSLDDPATWGLLRQANLDILRSSLVVVNLFETPGVLAPEPTGLKQQLTDRLTRELGVPLPVCVRSLSPDLREHHIHLIGETSAALPGYSIVKREELREIFSLINELYREINVIISGMDRNMRHDGSFLRLLDAEINMIQTYEAELVPSRVKAMSQIAGDFLPEALRTVTRKIGYYPGFVRLVSYASYPVSLDTWFFNVLSKYLLARLASYDMEYVEKCLDHWERVRPRAHGQLACDIGDFPRMDMERELDLYRQGIRRALSAPITNFNLKIFFIEIFRDCEDRIRGNLILFLGFLILGSIFGIAGLNTLAIGSWILALVVWLMGIWMLKRERDKVMKMAPSLRHAFESSIERDLYAPLMEGALCNVANYRNKLSRIHDKIFNLKEELDPIQRQLDSIYRTLKTIHNELF